jgi:hypothetical protein
MILGRLSGAALMLSGVAVGVTWLGAAAVRLGSLKLDRPRTDSAFHICRS